MLFDESIGPLNLSRGLWVIGDMKFPGDVDGYRHELNDPVLVSIWIVCGTPNRGMMCSRNT